MLKKILVGLGIAAGLGVLVSKFVNRESDETVV